MITITVTRTPLITIPIDQLKVGMTVENEDGYIGRIERITPTDEYPILVDFFYGATNSYTKEGFYIVANNVDTLEDLNYIKRGIKLFTFSRTPTINIPLDQLTGMMVEDENGLIGKICYIDREHKYPIKVEFSNGSVVRYSSDGFYVMDCDCYHTRMVKKCIKLVGEKKAVDVCANIEQPYISNNGLTAEELEAVNALVKTRGMTRAAAIMMILQ
jgi:hypothetical protein